MEVKLELGSEHCIRSFSMSQLDELLDDDSECDDLTPPSEMPVLELMTPTHNALQSSTDELTARPWDPIVWEVRLLLLEKLEGDLQEELDLVGHLDARNYLMWKYRRAIVKKIGATAARKELEFTGEIISKDFRNSHAWSHRQWILQEKKIGLATSRRELEFTAKIISEDANNRHAWFHRQWILWKLHGNARYFGLKEELDYSHEVIKNDVNNIFAWNQRLFIVRSTSEEGITFRRCREMEYAIHFILLEPGNECPWAYIRSLYKGDMESLFTYRFYVDVLEYDVNVADGLCVGGPYLHVDRLINRRGCLHALDLILELLNYGYTPEEDLIGVINSLYPESSLSPSKLTFSEKVLSIVQYLSKGVMMNLGAS